MSSENKRFCKINFIDGESRRFTYEAVRADEKSSIASAIQEMAHTQNLTFHVDGKLVIIPMNNVRTIEISPSPVNLPSTTIKATYID